MSAQDRVPNQRELATRKATPPWDDPTVSVADAMREATIVERLDDIHKRIQSIVAELSQIQDKLAEQDYVIREVANFIGMKI